MYGLRTDLSVVLYVVESDVRARKLQFSPNFGKAKIVRASYRVIYQNVWSSTSSVSSIVKFKLHQREGLERLHRYYSSTELASKPKPA